MLLDDRYDLGRELLHRVDHRAVRHIADGEINVHMPRPIKLYFLADPLRDTFCIANEEVLHDLFERFLVLVRHFLEQAEEVATAGATLLGKLLVVRGLGTGTRTLISWQRALWALLRPSVLGLDACPPRVWAT